MNLISSIMGDDLLSLYNSGLATERVAEVLEIAPDNAFSQLTHAIHQHAQGNLKTAMRTCSKYNLTTDEKEIICYHYTRANAGAIMDEIVGTPDKYRTARAMLEQPDGRKEILRMLSGRCIDSSAMNMFGAYCMLAECEILVYGQEHGDEIMDRWGLNSMQRTIVNCNLHPLFAEKRRVIVAPWTAKIEAIRNSSIIKRALDAPPSAKRAATEELQKYALETQIESHVAHMRLLETKLDAALARVASCEQTIALLTAAETRIPKIETRIVELQTAATQAHANNKCLHRDLTELKQSTTSHLGELAAVGMSVAARVDALQADIVALRPRDPRLDTPAPVAYPTSPWKMIYKSSGSSSLYERK